MNKKWIKNIILYIKKRIGNFPLLFLILVYYWIKIELNFRAKVQAIYKILNKTIYELGYDENTKITNEILNAIEVSLNQKEVSF